MDSDRELMRRVREGDFEAVRRLREEWEDGSHSTVIRQRLDGVLHEVMRLPGIFRLPSPTLRAAVRSGGTFSEALREYPLFPPFLRRLIAAGERQATWTPFSSTWPHGRIRITYQGRDYDLRVATFARALRTLDLGRDADVVADRSRGPEVGVKYLRGLALSPSGLRFHPDQTFHGGGDLLGMLLDQASVAPLHGNTADRFRAAVANQNPACCAEFGLRRG